MTGWNPANFKDDVLNIMLTLLAIIVSIASPVLVFGFKPRVEEYPEKPKNLKHLKDRSLSKILNGEESILKI